MHAAAGRALDRRAQRGLEAQLRRVVEPDHGGAVTGLDHGVLGGRVTSKRRTHATQPSPTTVSTLLSCWP